MLFHPPDSSKGLGEYRSSSPWLGMAGPGPVARACITAGSTSCPRSNPLSSSAVARVEQNGPMRSLMRLLAPAILCMACTAEPSLIEDAMVSSKGCFSCAWQPPMEIIWLGRTQCVEPCTAMYVHLDRYTLMDTSLKGMFPPTWGCHAVCVKQVSWTAEMDCEE